jgi:hypothetical protein
LVRKNFREEIEKYKAKGIKIAYVLTERFSKGIKNIITSEVG